MVNEINYISINELASRVLDNTLLSDVNIEQIIRHVLDFMANLELIIFIKIKRLFSLYRSIELYFLVI